MEPEMEENFEGPPEEIQENGDPENGYPAENGDHNDEEKPVSILDLEVKPPQSFRPRYPRFVKCHSTTSTTTISSVLSFIHSINQRIKLIQPIISNSHLSNTCMYVVCIVID